MGKRNGGTLNSITITITITMLRNGLPRPHAIPTANWQTLAIKVFWQFQLPTQLISKNSLEPAAITTALFLLSPEPPISRYKNGHKLLTMFLNSLNSSYTQTKHGFKQRFIVFSSTSTSAYVSLPNLLGSKGILSWRQTQRLENPFIWIHWLS